MWGLMKNQSKFLLAKKGCSASLIRPPSYSVWSDELCSSFRLWERRRLFSHNTQDKRSPNKNDSIPFGIVAAMSKNGVIGLNGRIPWRIPRDRMLFKNLTDKGIIIVGKRTYEEHPMLAHIHHTRCCIIVSRSIKTIIKPISKYAPNTVLKLARSLPEALELAGQFEEELLVLNDKNKNKAKQSSHLTCWIAGGQQLYEEALTHDSASELHLSVVDIEIEYSTITRGDQQQQQQNVALFPPKDLWMDRFEENEKILYPQDDDAPSFNCYIYKRKSR